MWEIPTNRRRTTPGSQYMSRMLANASRRTPDAELKVTSRSARGHALHRSAHAHRHDIRLIH